MKKSLVLYRMDMDAIKKMMETTTPEERKKGMDEWGAWMKQHASDFVDMGGPAGKNMHMTPTDSKQESNDIGGYSVIQAESAEAAALILKDNPHFKMPGATMDLMEVTSMGM